MNIDKWLDNRLGKGHHFNSQILIDFNKEVNKEWIEGIEKIAEIRFVLEEHGKIVDKLYQFTDRSWQELKMGVL